MCISFFLKVRDFMNENFKILNNSKKTINYINKLLVNYPKKEVILKQNIERNNYEIIQLIYYYVVNKDSKRIYEKYLKDLIVKLSMLDYYMLNSYQNKIISTKKYNVISNYIIEIRKMVYGILKSEKVQEEVR